MSESDQAKPQQSLSDEYGNIHFLADELARGGQGVVFRTRDADLAIKQPLDASWGPDNSANLRARFQNIRILPLPPRIPISLPLAILRDEPGYVMRLLSGMMPFGAFDLDGRTKGKLQERNPPLPEWLSAIPDKDFALRLFYFAETGSTRRRLFALSKCASILARLHSAGLVYGDVSENNAFFGEGTSREIWLIDADNLRFELAQGGKSVYTPRLGAPEVVQGRDQSRPRTDCWAFAVMTFKMLTLIHPFIGKKVLQSSDEEDSGWDAEPSPDGAPADLDEKAYAGFLPFVDDEDDDANASEDGLPRILTTTPGLRRLFQETFGPGRIHPHRRPGMGFWALELARACDQMLECRGCGMSYFAEAMKECPFCGAPRPAFVRVKTSRWEVLIPFAAVEFALPHRLFHPFSLEHNDDTECEAAPHFATRTVVPVRGTKPFPEGLNFEFVEATK